MFNRANFSSPVDNRTIFDQNGIVHLQRGFDYFDANPVAADSVCVESDLVGARVERTAAYFFVAASAALSLARAALSRFLMP